jgi:coenzyme F420-reducing hydrogenase alpha subunit
MSVRVKKVEVDDVEREREEEREEKARRLLVKHLKNVLNDTLLLLEYARTFEFYNLKGAILDVLKQLEENGEVVEVDGEESASGKAIVKVYC